jgi:hypothetical protein
MDYRKLIELKTKDTIGYSEAENKKSFMRGVSVAISKMEDVYNDKIKNLELQLKYTKENGETYKKDLKTLASIIDKYSENND